MDAGEDVVTDAGEDVGADVGPTVAASTNTLEEISQQLGSPQHHFPSGQPLTGALSFCHCVLVSLGCFVVRSYLLKFERLDSQLDSPGPGCRCLSNSMATPRLDPCILVSTIAFLVVHCPLFSPSSDTSHSLHRYRLRHCSRLPQSDLCRSIQNPVFCRYCKAGMQCSLSRFHFASNTLRSRTISMSNGGERRGTSSKKAVKNDAEDEVPSLFLAFSCCCPLPRCLPLYSALKCAE